MTARNGNVGAVAVTLALLAAGCGASAGERPVELGPVNTGAGTLASARKFLEGRWVLESFEMTLAGKPPVLLKGSGTLVYDNMGNLRMEIQADAAATDLLRAGGIDIRDGVISTDGRTVVDMQNRTLTYVLPKQAPVVKGGPLAMERPRHWVVDGDTLILTTKDDAGSPLTVARWKRSPDAAP